MQAELKTRLADLECAARAAEGCDDDLAGIVAGLGRAFRALCRVLEEERPGIAQGQAVEQAVTLADSDQSEEVPGSGRRRPAYHRGGRVSDMVRPLERSETELGSHAVRRLALRYLGK